MKQIIASVFQHITSYAWK